MYSISYISRIKPDTTLKKITLSTSVISAFALGIIFTISYYLPLNSLYMCIPGGICLTSLIAYAIACCVQKKTEISSTDSPKTPTPTPQPPTVNIPEKKIDNEGPQTPSTDSPKPPPPISTPQQPTINIPEKKLENESPQTAVLGLEHFSQIQSGDLIFDQKFQAIQSRDDFLKSQDWQTQPPVIVTSAFVPDNMVEHLMRNKRDLANGTKFIEGHEITNMEGALHTFVVPICSVHMVGDYCYDTDHHDFLPFGLGNMRQVVMSALLQPDFEFMNVMLPVVRLYSSECVGENLTKINIPTVEEKKDKKLRIEYDDHLCKHMIYHLTASHSLPAIQDVHPMDKTAAIAFLETAIGSNSFAISEIENTFLQFENDIFDIDNGIKTIQIVISLEALFNVYLNSLRSELMQLDKLLPQGFIYTIDPPSIFVRRFGCKLKPRQYGDAVIANRLNILAFKQICKELKNLKVVAFSNHADSKTVDLLQQAVQGSSIQACTKKSLFPSKDKKPTGFYEPPKNCSQYALVVHNNSDAFGQNIEFEGRLGSLDGAIGESSDAACVLKRNRKDLLNYVYQV